MQPVTAVSLMKEKPNIIIIMSESFWDPTSIESLEFGTDPMPTVRKYQKGEILSPTFGGGTSNVEFEALTGFSNMFLPPGSVPYQQYIKNELPALPRYLNGLGYETKAVHPYPKWFWNREQVYKHIGFEEFKDIDGFKDPFYKGPFVSDEQVTKTIIEQTEQTEEPVFTYAITMQNHTGYNSDKYPEYAVETHTPPEVDPVFNLLLRSYTQGISDADAALKQLIDYYETSDEPTLVVFFGDRLPAIGRTINSSNRPATYRTDKETSTGNSKTTRTCTRRLWSSGTISEPKYRTWAQSAHRSSLPPYSTLPAGEAPLLLDIGKLQRSNARLYNGCKNRFRRRTV